MQEGGREETEDMRRGERRRQKVEEGIDRLEKRGGQRMKRA